MATDSIGRLKILKGTLRFSLCRRDPNTIYDPYYRSEKGDGEENIRVTRHLEKDVTHTNLENTGPNGLVGHLTYKIPVKEGKSVRPLNFQRRTEYHIRLRTTKKDSQTPKDNSKT